MKKKMRKPQPSPPNYVWWDLDNCWFCDNRNNCHNCKVMKQYVIEQKNKRKRKEKEKLRKGEYEDF